jgi:hypothetical protein
VALAEISGQIEMRTAGYALRRLPEAEISVVDAA